MGVTEIRPRHPEEGQIGFQAVHVAGDITFDVSEALAGQAETRSLVEELTKLQVQVAELTARVAALGG